MQQKQFFKLLPNATAYVFRKTTATKKKTVHFHALFTLLPQVTA